MRFFITSILLLALIYAAAGSPCGTSTWMLPANSSSNSNSTTGASFCVQLNPNITLQYALVGSDQVLFHVDASLPPNTAYFGLGLSELGSMKGADMAIFHHSNSNSQASAVSSQPQEGSTTNSIAGWHLVDSYAPGFVTPVADSQQDVKLLDLSYSASNNTLSATWQRPLVPCVVNGGGGGGDQAASEEDLPLAVGMPVHVIWAHGRSWAYHGRNRGGKLIKFALEDGASSTGGDNSSSTAALNGTTSSMDAATGSSNGNESDIRVLDLVFPADTPPQETTYWVQYIKLPDDRKYHIIKYEPIVRSPMLHHGVAYSCLKSDEAKVEALPNLGPYDRLKQGMLCEQFFMMLASNMTPWQAPAVAALPFGANSTRYVALELHYNNPDALQGQRDPGSGIRIYYTPKLREHDVGVLTLSQFVLDIPPGNASYATNASICPSGCTARFKQPVQLLSGFFHMHGLGKDIITRHYRGGRELTPLGHLRAFDYQFQNNLDIYAPDAKVLLPGGALSLQCTFDSTSRTNVTQMGPGTRDEMCFYWISYFPAQEDMGYCMSFGNATIASCGADVKSDTTFAAFTDPQLFANLTAQGLLMSFPGNPAVNSTPYTEQCANISAAT